MQSNTVLINEVFTNGRGLFTVFSPALVQVLESIGYIVCITEARGKSAWENRSQRVVYEFQCDMCDANYVGYTHTTRWDVSSTSASIHAV